MTYGYCVYHEIECDYKGSCIDCPHNTADYETNLKAEKIAMLKDLQLEIEEMDSRAGYDGGGMPTFSTDYIRKKKVNEFIQQKINALNGKGEQWK